MGSEAESKSLVLKNYFVDESGDGTLFNRYGTVIVGNEGCTRYFILGVLDIPNPDDLSTKLNQLRSDLLADPYFKKVPSMQLGNRKTAICFHAKDDVAEVRREVFSLLRKEKGLQFFAVVRDKLKVVEEVKRRNTRTRSYRYNPNELYDSLVSRLFKEKLHKADEYNIYFSKRGKSDRTEALQNALDVARKRFAKRWKITSNAPINIYARKPEQHCGLQAVDYFLWTLQRLYERKEDRYIEYIWPACKLVIDVDDTRTDNYGVYYTKKNPISITTLRE